MDTDMAGMSPHRDAEPPDKPSTMSSYPPSLPTAPAATTAPFGSTPSTSPHDTAPPIDQHMEAQWCFSGTEDDLPLVGRLANGVEDIRRGMNACYSVAYEERTRRKESQARAVSLQSELDQEIAQRIAAEGMIRELEQRNSSLQQELDNAHLENEQLQRQLNEQANIRSPGARLVAKPSVSVPPGLTPRSLQTRGGSSVARRATPRHGSVRPSVAIFHEDAQDAQAKSRSQPTVELTSNNYTAHDPAPGTQRITVASMDQSLGSFPSPNLNPEHNGTQHSSVSSDSAYKSDSGHQAIKLERDDRGMSKCISDFRSFESEDERPKRTNSIPKNNSNPISSSPVLALGSSSQDSTEKPHSPSASSLLNDTPMIEAHPLEQQITEPRQEILEKDATQAPKRIWALRETERLEKSELEESELEEGEVVEDSETLTLGSVPIKPMTELARPPFGGPVVDAPSRTPNSVAKPLQSQSVDSKYDPSTPVVASSPNERPPGCNKWRENVKVRKAQEKENEEYLATLRARNPKAALLKKQDEERLTHLAKLAKEEKERKAEVELKQARKAAREQAANEQADKEQAQKEEAERQQAQKDQAERERVEKKQVKREQTKLPSLTSQPLARRFHAPPAKSQFGLETASAPQENRPDERTRHTARPAPKPSSYKDCGQEILSEKARERHSQHCYSRGRAPPQAEKHHISPPASPTHKKVDSRKPSQVPASITYRKVGAPPRPSGPPPHKKTDSRKPSQFSDSQAYGRNGAPPPPSGLPPPAPPVRSAHPAAVRYWEKQARELAEAEMAEREETKRREDRDMYDKWRR
ncbi:uncharacterized protein BDZ99DRAFT_546825 [Mytilinidion resinicola]|uniref:Uncharacterized protein n=1 Tax=Mytilinidion resinicola TaxID=574789 RepID=A0A6A6Y478_9PEZI|nr:uncharacterized protein BDZ99DRAFT_546825 [Mytilinidion resinicola]KAF2803592.1 hypothetical protein BDZ99DRAFT_546825 [Mytilinidion resinicola]